MVQRYEELMTKWPVLHDFTQIKGISAIFVNEKKQVNRRMIEV
jgi:hypothetical protein